MEKKQFTKTDQEIKVEIYKALNKLGASNDLLAVIASWKDTMTDEFTLSSLKLLNNDESIWQNKLIQRDEINPKDN